MLDQQFRQSLMGKKEMLICWVCIWCWLEEKEKFREIGPCCFLRVGRHVLSGCLKDRNDCRPLWAVHVDDCVDGFWSMGLSVMVCRKPKNSWVFLANAQAGSFLYKLYHAHGQVSIFQRDTRNGSYAF